MGLKVISTLCTFPTVTAALGQANFLHVKEWYAQYGISNSPRGVAFEFENACAGNLQALSGIFDCRGYTR
jgi:hypothetical protein